VNTKIQHYSWKGSSKIRSFCNKIFIHASISGWLCPGVYLLLLVNATELLTIQMCTYTAGSVGPSVLHKPLQFYG